MRHMFQVPVVAIFLSVVLALSAESRLLAAEPAPPDAKGKPAPAAAAKPAPQKENTMTLLIDNLALKPATPQKAPTVLEKLKTLGTLLGRALDVAVDLLSNNNMKALSDNKATLLSGNAPNILSGNAPKVLSGNTAKVLSENTTPILSGNTFSMFSNIRVEIHINNSPAAMAQPGTAATARPTAGAAPPVRQTPSVPVPPGR